MTNKPDLIFAFDLGTGSIGECVRQGKDVKHLASLLLPAEFASIKDAAQRRRAWRTRLSHRARVLPLENILVLMPLLSVTEKNNI